MRKPLGPALPHSRTNGWRASEPASFAWRRCLTASVYSTAFKWLQSAPVRARFCCAMIRTCLGRRDRNVSLDAKALDQSLQKAAPRVEAVGTSARTDHE